MTFDHRVPEKQSRFLTFFTTLPGVITAVATLIAAVGGLLVAINEFGGDKPARVTAESPDPRPSAVVTSPATNPSTSQSSNESPSPSTEASNADPTDLNLDLSGVIVQKTMTVKLDDIVYLSDGTTGGAWANGDFKLITGDTGTLRLYGGRPILDEFARITSGTVSKRSCSSLLDHPAGEFRVKSSDTGTWVCIVRPDGYNGSYGAIHFDQVDLVERRITISYVVWS
ncbi:MAG: hypothetical protein HOU81_05880 [Hamadaea sp.]|uniref:hypothetical protein n=1 Tax=Hamadaea sp. TaxID=2024425 RepID=UPI00181D121F|nr:hypothetical protein [Hamadaea sp.]NUR70328.1 hypothetical protein [Hamadaea sp.]NUT21950.1 hypothetical protein [Hamadaea sp.]